MAVGIEDILLARAQADEQGQMNAGNLATVLGAGIGGTAGVALGDVAQRMQGESQQSIMRARNPLNKARPGVRMAGGLVGAILGGALGAGTAQMMKQNSPAADMLAKLQSQGDLSASDTAALQQVLGDTYSSTLSM